MVNQKLSLVEHHSIAYTEHDPINITSDADFIAQAALEGWDGNGSEDIPYMIYGYNITHKGYNIRIVNVNVYFQIVDCYLTSNSTGVLTDPYDDGICLINVSHATVRYNEIVNNEDSGLYVESSDIRGNWNVLLGNNRGMVFNNVTGWQSYCDIIDSTDISVWILNCIDFHFGENYVSTKTGLGMLMQDSSYCDGNNDFDSCSVELRDCTDFYIRGDFYNGSGLFLDNCSQINVLGEIVAPNELHTNNFYNKSAIVIDRCSEISVSGYVFAPSDYGILVSRSNHITVSFAIINSSAIAGIVAMDSLSCNYTANTISDCQNGILIRNGTSSLITHNYIFNQTEYGIRIDSGSDNWIYANLVASEGGGFFLDDGNENHWDDGLFLGNFMVGITEGDFAIDGSAGNIDHFARTIDLETRPVNESVICSDPIIAKFNDFEEILAWVVWLRSPPSSFYYVLYDIKIDGESVPYGEWYIHYYGFVPAPCTIIVDISDTHPGIHSFSFDFLTAGWGEDFDVLLLSEGTFLCLGFCSLDDEDADGMFDIWEVANGLDPMIDDSALDLDSDDLINIDELFLGTDPQNPDSDFDFMPDGWEIMYDLDPLFHDSILDPDSDGLVNLDEYLHRTDPSRPDSDFDMMTDKWEVVHGLDPRSASDASLDSDLDTLTNLQEFYLGTDPTNPDSDLDSFPDGWEVRNGYDPLDSLAPPYEYMLYYSPFIASAYTTLMAVAAVILFMDRHRNRLSEKLASD